MSAAGAISTRWTVWPLMSMPRISPAFSTASCGSLASFTPPALPRPPILTWALTTTSAAVLLGCGLGVGGVGDDGADLHGHAVLGEELLRLVLHQIHVSTQSFHPQPSGRSMRLAQAIPGTLVPAGPARPRRGGPTVCLGWVAVTRTGSVTTPPRPPTASSPTSTTRSTGSSRWAAAPRSTRPTATRRSGTSSSPAWDRWRWARRRTSGSSTTTSCCENPAEVARLLRRPAGVRLHPPRPPADPGRGPPVRVRRGRRRVRRPGGGRGRPEHLGGRRRRPGRPVRRRRPARRDPAQRDPVFLGAGAPLLPRRITSERVSIREARQAGQRVRIVLDVRRPAIGGRVGRATTGSRRPERPRRSARRPSR